MQDSILLQLKSSLIAMKKAQLKITVLRNSNATRKSAISRRALATQTLKFKFFTEPEYFIHKLLIIPMRPMLVRYGIPRRKG
jgi:hypothetical protein